MVVVVVEDKEDLIESFPPHPLFILLRPNMVDFRSIFYNTYEEKKKLAIFCLTLVLTLVQ